MKPPRLNRRITVEVPTITKDPTYQSNVPGWAPLVALPGSPVIGAKFAAEVQDVLPSRSEEGDLRGLQVSRRRSRVRMRWRSDMNATMRITIHGDINRVAQIVTEPAEILGPKRYIEFMVEDFSTEAQGE